MFTSILKIILKIQDFWCRYIQNLKSVDEPTSALDVTIQSQILNLLNDLQNKYELTYIFISHDLNVIKAVSDYIIVMKNGRIVEEGKKDDIIKNARTKYTQSLLQASL